MAARRQGLVLDLTQPFELATTQAERTFDDDSLLIFLVGESHRNKNYLEYKRKTHTN
jgi:hypothetical protein